MLSSRYEAVGLLDYARSGAGVGWGTESSGPTETDQNVRGEAAPNRWCWGEMLYTLHCTLCAELDSESNSTLCTEISEYCVSTETNGDRSRLLFCKLFSSPKTQRGSPY